MDGRRSDTGEVASPPRLSVASQRRISRSDGGGPVAEDRPRRSSFVTIDLSFGDLSEDLPLRPPSPSAPPPPPRLSITHLLSLVQQSSRSNRVSQWEPHVCRICLDGDAEEELLPLSCRCKGDLGTVHALCATRWFVDDRGAPARAGCGSTQTHRA